MKMIRPWGASAPAVLVDDRDAATGRVPVRLSKPQWSSPNFLAKEAAPYQAAIPIRAIGDTLPAHVPGGAHTDPAPLPAPLALRIETAAQQLVALINSGPLPAEVRSELSGLALAMLEWRDELTGESA